MTTAIKLEVGAMLNRKLIPKKVTKPEPGITMIESSKPAMVVVVILMLIAAIHSSD